MRKKKIIIIWGEGREYVGVSLGVQAAKEFRATRNRILVFKSSNGYWLGARPEGTAEGGRHPHVTTWERKLDKDDRA